MRMLLLVLFALLAAAAPAAANELPLGPGWLQETQTSEPVAPGVSYTRIERGFASPRDVFTVDVGFTSTRAEARELRRRLGSPATAHRSSACGSGRRTIPSAVRWAIWSVPEPSPPRRPPRRCARSS